MRIRLVHLALAASLLVPLGFASCGKQEEKDSESKSKDCGSGKKAETKDKGKAAGLASGSDVGSTSSGSGTGSGTASGSSSGSSSGSGTGATSGSSTGSSSTDCGSDTGSASETGSTATASPGASPTTGAAGKTGAAGTTGASATTGATGTTGATATTGAPGTTGAVGATGETDTDLDPADDGEILGEVSDETAGGALTAKSVYGLFSDAGGTKSVSLMIYSEEVRDSIFRKVKAYKCEKCKGDDDENCKDPETVATKSISVSFFNIPTIAEPLDANGFPKETNYDKSNADDNDSGMAISFSDGAAAKQGTGKLKFLAKATKIDDPFEAEVDFKFDGGKNYKAKVKGKVHKLPTNPTAPTCADNEFLDVTYE